MPQCMCGCHFTTTTFDMDNKESDLCPSCRNNSSPKSYSSSYQWDCENISGQILDINSSSRNSSYDS